MDELIGDFVDSMVKGAIEKALSGFVTDGTLTQAQAGTVTAATMIEIEAAIEIYSKSKTPPAA